MARATCLLPSGIELSYLHEGEGPLVILCHGFPETAYSWRHQLSFLGSQGYHAIAPDMRGYGDSSRPLASEEYGIFQLAGDIVSLVKSFGAENCVIVGHDWGAPVAWHCALIRPDIFRGVVGLSVPFNSHRARDVPTKIMRDTSSRLDLPEFYMVYFQEEGRAEAELEEDLDFTIRSFLASNQSKGAFRTHLNQGHLLSHSEVFDPLPAWLEEQDIKEYVRSFSKSGMRGPLSYYRNIDRNWRLMEAFEGKRIEVPASFIVGELDPVRGFSRSSEDRLGESFTDLRGKHVLAGVGHWIQQQAAEEVNLLLADFLASIL